MKTIRVFVRTVKLEPIRHEGVYCSDGCDTCSYLLHPADPGDPFCVAFGTTITTDKGLPIRCEKCREITG